MYSKKHLAILGCCLFIMACSADPAPAQSARKQVSASSQNNHAAQIAQALQKKSINIVQIGDSHTAADYLTDAARVYLQQQLGNGGPGWAMPTQFPGLRLARFTYQNQGWQAISSRTDTSQNYALGGLVAVPSVGAVMTIKTRGEPEAEQTVTVTIRQGPNDEDLTITDSNGKQIELGAQPKDNQWHFSQFNARFPITVTAGMNFQTAIGGWWVRNPNRQGVVFSALGINGAQLTQWQRWNTQAWQQELNVIAPDLIILAYGTNEAYNGVEIETVKQNLIETINRIRAASPNSAIMILGAPESLKSTAGSCGVRPEKLTELQEMQKEVAQSQQVFFWDWQAVMGGECSMKPWINQGLARNDGVHFTSKGYQRLGQALGESILSMRQQR
ncbi:SGNH/GDSL hydrolase family protein [Snodgrassella alvi]|uniref:SGNH/GDSL hydrolase family protein n=1 Tax=Snodgrassella alvi TaxID=1196083 RepID=UPI001552AD96|nr:SGNH/GDSL hydrolase family protein [Snodgrassella alvi]